jgi:RNA polymerase sigma-70 factor (ECF subfamily)
VDEVTDKQRLDRDFTELYRAHLRDVYSYAYYRIGNHHDAEDLTEQTFLQAYRHFERAQRESNGRPLRPWLIRIAHNLAANYYRDRSRRPQTNIDDAGALSTPHTTESLVEDRDDLARILAVPPNDARREETARYARRSWSWERTAKMYARILGKAGVRNVADNKIGLFAPTLTAK